MSNLTASSRDVEAAPLVLTEDPPVPQLGVILLEMLWKAFDAVVLFRMGTIYMHRFEDFSYTAHVEYNEEVDSEITEWRRVQQEEWTRLSNTVCLQLSTRSAISDFGCSLTLHRTLI
jgi:hypothetical protein